LVDPTKSIANPSSGPDCRRRFGGKRLALGSVRQSGLGREGSRHGIEDYVETKYLCPGDIAR
jgi:acyl-CoA reductase-like NAD-dependent aldehyde dehydrogenase